MFIKRAINVQNNQYGVDVPDACPICHHDSEIQVIQADQVDNGENVQVIFRCAYVGCRHFFFGYYGPRPQGELKSIKPSKPDLTVFTDAVREISPAFVAIFGEAEEAEQSPISSVMSPISSVMRESRLSPNVHCGLATTRHTIFASGRATTSATSSPSSN